MLSTVDFSVSIDRMAATIDTMTRVFTEEENNIWAKQLPGKMTSACLAVQNKDKVLMVKAGYKDHWTFPSGIVDDKESPKQAALRETREETGLQFDDAKCELLGVIYTASNGADRDRFNFGFSVKVADINNLSLSIPNDEIEDFRWVGFDQVAAMSGDKASYVKFQSILLSQQPRSSYIEVRP